MLWFILCVAVLNMAAGFGLGVYLARFSFGSGGIPGEESGWGGSATEGFGDFEAAIVGGPGEQEVSNETVEAAEESSDETTASEETSTEVASEADPSDEMKDRDAGVEKKPENSIMADLDAAVSAALGDLNLPQGGESGAESDDGHATTPEDKETSATSGGLEKFHSQLELFCAELVDLDNRIRATVVETGDDLKSQADAVAASSEKQDLACREAEESVRTLIDSEAIGEKDGEAAIAAIQEERREAAEAVDSLSRLDFDTDPASQQDAVLEHTAKLLDANHGLRDRVAGMVASAQPDAKEGADIDDLDPLTKIRSRAALDATLAAQWKKDPHHARPLAFAAIDIDQFGKINRTYGPSVGDRVLRAVGQLIAAEIPDEYIAARFAGQRFAMLTVDRDLKQAVNDVERIRQTIESLKLKFGEDELELTVSCGVVAGATDDTHESLYARALASTQEAKRYGRNRTFVHEGKRATPVVPPNLAPNERHVTI